MTVAVVTVAVVGGGPAGLMAAEFLRGAGHRVTIYDRMPSVGRKFLLAGRGGLNITHSEPLDRLLGRYTGLPAHFIEAFSPAALRAWCEGLGEKVFVGSSGRVFPEALKATPLLRAWLRRLGSCGVELRTGHCWSGWVGERLRFETAGGTVLEAADAVVLALGGASWPRLGSDGGWVNLLAQEGVAVAPLEPANCGFLCDWSAIFRGRFAGAPLKRIALSFAGVTVRGEAMVTEDGLEGGAIYALSGALRAAIARDGSAELIVDLRPDLDIGAVTARLGGHGVSMANAMRRAGLDAAAAGLVREAGDAAVPLAARVKNLRLVLRGTRPIARAISTAGGVRFDGLDGLMLTARPGVFVAGEMLDWDAPTGGYLLQACLSTGRAAGDQADAWLRRQPPGRPIPQPARNS